MNLKVPLLRGVYAKGFERPSLLQQKALLPIFEGRDVIAQSDYGAGKTTLLAIGILQRIKVDLVACQAIVVSDMRDIALQTQKLILALADYQPPDQRIRCHCCIGGTRVADDVEKLKEGVHIVVGTPGRIFDLMMRKALDWSHVHLLCLDDFDEMLSSDFRDQLYAIYTYLPIDSLQIVCTSFVLPHQGRELTERLMRNPVHVLIKRSETSLFERVRHFYIDVPPREDWKFDTLCDLYDTLNITQALVFCNTNRKVASVTEKYRARHFTVSSISSDTSVQERSLTLEEFRTGSCRTLIVPNSCVRLLGVLEVLLDLFYLFIVFVKIVYLLNLFLIFRFTL